MKSSKQDEKASDAIDATDNAQLQMKNDDDDDDDDGHGGGDSISVASSMSSIPLIELKKQYLAAKQKNNKDKATKNHTHTTATATATAAKKKSTPNKGSPKRNAAGGAASSSRKPKGIKSSTTKEGERKKNVKVIPKSGSTKDDAGNTTSAARAPASATLADGQTSTSSSSEEEEEAACCLCHCGVDCSDRALFFPKDRKKELEDEDGDYYFQMDDPYLPETLYDRNNALVYCDSCNRLYHQKCHFVPLLVVPRGDWNCLLCSLNKSQPQKPSPAGAKKSKSKTNGMLLLASPTTDTTTTTTTAASSKNTLLEPWKKFCDNKISSMIFTSPPPAILSKEVRDLQDEFELLTALPKAQMWHRQLIQLRTFLKSQAGNIRMATAALSTLTSTKRNRAHFAAGGKKSQELAQTLVRLATGKWKIRTALLSLENIRVAANVLPPELLQWGEKYPKQLAHVFPHGIDLYVTRRRIIPRTREMELLLPPVVASTATATATAAVRSTSPNGTSLVPLEITVLSPNATKELKSMIPPLESPKSPKRIKKLISGLSPKSPKRNALSPKTKKSNTLTKAMPMMPDPNEARNGKLIVGSQLALAPAPATTTSKDQDQDQADNDSGISLDDLKCCVCFVGDATDDNDVLLCDGEGCCRAFHMNCVVPEVQIKDIEDENENWFCPLCSAISHLTAEVQLACMDEDWEHRRETEDYHKLEDSSLHSWSNADDVFPEAEWEYNASMKYLAGKQNEETVRLLALYLGEDFFQNESGGILMPVGSDSEDENDYSLFDENSFEERRRREREGLGERGDDDSDDSDDDDDGDESTRSSQASLVDMSSVELKIDKSELAALSDGGGGSSSEEDSSLSGASSTSSAKRRKSRRLRNKKQHASGQSTTTSLVEPGADFDENNIIEGKRQRKFVDYRKLNDALFGDLSAKERAKLDDKDDFVEVRKQKRKTPTGRQKKRQHSKVNSTGKTETAGTASKRSRKQVDYDTSDGENTSDDSGQIQSSESEIQSDGDGRVILSRITTTSFPKK